MITHLRKRYLKTHKKGVIEVGFSWIFIMIAGVVILGLFLYIGVNQGSFFKTLLDTDLLSDLSTILAGSQVSQYSAAVYQIPNTDLEFSCNSFSIDGTRSEMEQRFLFAPPELSTDQLISWSLPWSLGFRITNFLLITSPYIKYYVVYDAGYEQQAKEIYHNLPFDYRKELLILNSSNSLVNEGYDRVHVLLLGTRFSEDLPDTFYDEDNFRGYKNSDIVFVSVAQTTKKDLAKVELVMKDKKQETIYPLITSSTAPGDRSKKFIDETSLYAAFVSGNPDMVDCMMTKAYKRSLDVVQIYSYRLDALQPDSATSFSTSASCSGYLSQAQSVISDIHAQLLAEPLLVDDLYETILDLSTINANFRINSCPLIY